MSNERDDYLLGATLAIKIAVGAIAFRQVANSLQPDMELKALNELAHRLLANEAIGSNDPNRGDKIRSIGEQQLDDIIGNIAWRQG
ncbi:hypothetical protein [Brucella sp. NBRC 12950]|uniref:hypothetical protein n=1 Tax=Brucella sp. NBRC 12950 TaxID=2994518 RepID=UPI0024A2DED6|nr:hypothetical protein [Brucella sp. NBRC 12950]GLU29459.1 hypothetical protein Brsp01_46920 [Brucella sp. NBRC 12950]